MGTEALLTSCRDTVPKEIVVPSARVPSGGGGAGKPVQGRGGGRGTGRASSAQQQRHWGREGEGQ